MDFYKVSLYNYIKLKIEDDLILSKFLNELSGLFATPPPAPLIDDKIKLVNVSFYDVDGRRPSCRDSSKILYRLQDTSVSNGNGPKKI